MPGFWDRALRRFHFAFVSVSPDAGRDFLQRAMENASNPQRIWPAALFVLTPVGPGRKRPPVLSEDSIQLLAVNCPSSNLGSRARRIARPLWTSDQLDARLRAAEPPDVTRQITEARGNIALNPGAAVNEGEDTTRVIEQLSGSLLPPPTLEQMQRGEEAAMAFCPALCLFLGVVSRRDPKVYAPAVLEDFVHLWRQYLAGSTAPRDFWLLCFRPLVQEALQRVPAPEVHPGWTWIDDPDERRFLECGDSILSHVDRVALFLVLYGGLNIQQLIVVLCSIVPQGWKWTKSIDEAMNHLTERWLDVVEEMIKREKGLILRN
jgi:hypothetical protein